LTLVLPLRLNWHPKILIEKITNPIYILSILVIKSMNKLKKRLENYSEEELIELYETMITTEHGSKWEKLMNILYNGSKDSINKVYSSEFFEYYSKVFKDTPYLDEMKRLLYELEGSTDKILSKIDRHYIQSINLIKFLLEEDGELEKA